MYDKRVLGLAEARAAVDAVLRAAEGHGGRPIVVAVADPDGDLIALARMDGAGHLPRRMAVRKAYTSARMETDTGAYGERLRGSGLDVKDMGDPELVAFAGGVCVREGDQVVGAIGVSGRSAAEDEELARAGLAALATK